MTTLCFLFSQIIYTRSIDDFKAQICILNENCSVVKSANCTGITECWQIKCLGGAWAPLRNLTSKYNDEAYESYVTVHIYQHQKHMHFPVSSQYIKNS